MNYSKIYDQLISHARQNPPQGYTESHHVIPRCMGGDDAPSNLVDLTARQHFIAHWLLTKIHPTMPGLWYAFHMMFHPTSANTRQTDWVQSHSRVYERNKQRMAEDTSLRFTGVPKSTSHREKMCEAAVTRWSDDETSRRVLSERMKGNKLSLGRKIPCSEETKRKISESNKGHRTGPRGPLPADVKAKISATKQANPRVVSDEERHAQSKRMMGHRQPQSQRDAVRAALSQEWDVTPPSGERIVVTNLRQFCREHQLNQGNLSTYGRTKGYSVTKRVS